MSSPYVCPEKDCRQWAHHPGPCGQSAEQIAQALTSLAYDSAVAMHESIVAGRGATGWQDKHVLGAIAAALAKAEARADAAEAERDRWKESSGQNWEAARKLEAQTCPTCLKPNPRLSTCPCRSGRSDLCSTPSCACICHAAEAETRTLRDKIETGAKLLEQYWQHENDGRMTTFFRTLAPLGLGPFAEIADEIDTTDHAALAAPPAKPSEPPICNHCLSDHGRDSHCKPCVLPKGHEEHRAAQPSQPQESIASAIIRAGEATIAHSHAPAEAPAQEPHED